jgi:hypothetical protein
MVEPTDFYATRAKSAVFFLPEPSATLQKLEATTEIRIKRK